MFLNCIFKQYSQQAVIYRNFFTTNECCSAKGCSFLYKFLYCFYKTVAKHNIDIIDASKTVFYEQFHDKNNFQENSCCCWQIMHLTTEQRVLKRSSLKAYQLNNMASKQSGSQSD